MSEKIAVICIGDELLKGAVVNTNLASIGVRLLALGVVPVSSVEVPDRRADILAALEFSLARADIVITSGGLGPTADDVTKEYIAERCGMRLEEDGAAALNIMKHWKMRHPSEEIPPRVFNQALVPHGAKVIQNDCGTAPGLILRTPDTDEFPGRTVIMLPGPPNELCPMMDASVVPFLKKTLKHFTFTREFHVHARIPRRRAGRKHRRGAHAPRYRTLPLHAVGRILRHRPVRPAFPHDGIA